MVASFRYSDALETDPDSKVGLHKLYGNRSLAYTKAQHYRDAAADAGKCIELAPQWPKGYWRLGMALLGLKQTLQAIQAFAECWRLDHCTKPLTQTSALCARELCHEQCIVCINGKVSRLHLRFNGCTRPWLDAA